MNVGPALKYLRMRKELTLEEVTRKLNTILEQQKITDVVFNKGKISKWENGKEEPKLSALKYVADFYGVTIDEMISFSMKEAEKQDIETFNSLVESLRDLGLNIEILADDNERFNIYISSEDNSLNISYYEFVKDPVLTYENVVKELITNEQRKLPLLGQIACGSPILAQENIEDYFTIDKKLKADFVLKCKGDSMIDEGILPGDYVFIRKQQTLENGEIGAILIDNEATLKRFYKNGNQIILQPANSNYQPIILDHGHVNIVGKLVAVLNIKN